MSDLRDARLRRALEEAPDADLRPDPRTRRAVLDAARQAAAPRVTGWQRLWQGLGQRSLGWNAALATVLMATVVTALWYEREILDARPEPDVAQSRTPESVAKRAPELPAAPPAAMRDQPAREELAKSTPAPAPPAAAAASQAMSRTTPAAGLASQAPVVANWTHARIAMQGRSAGFSREQLPALAALLDRLARETHSREPLEAQAETRIELTRGGAPAGTVELAGPQLRWIRPGGSTSTTRPDAAQLRALREELSRLLQR